MRTALAAAILIGAAALTHAQPAREPPPRYGVKARPKLYPQETPKEALRSALAAAEKGDYKYLVAQLMEPKFVDGAVAERAKATAARAELDLARLRNYQLANRGRIDPEDRLPTDRQAFQSLVAAKAQDLAFQQLVRDVSQKLGEDPQTLRDFRRILAGGAITEGDPAAATHPDLKGRTLYLRKVGDRWFLENRQGEEKKE